MPVWKFRDLEEAEIVARTPGQINNLRLALELSKLGMSLAGITPQRGVRKFRSIKDANADRDRTEDQRDERASAR